jgi:tRNA threonylcarbamoyladenosine biosynthesis protein TsaE
MTEVTLQTETVDQTRRLAAAVARRLARPAVVALSGRLGAGKTQFIKGLGAGLGLDPDRICSATFVLIAEYHDPHHLVHIDAYRLSRPEDLENIGWYELLEEPDTLIAVEWAEKIRPLLPLERLDVRIDILDDHRRALVLVPHGPAIQDALRQALADS